MSADNMVDIDEIPSLLKTLALYAKTAERYSDKELQSIIEKTLQELSGLYAERMYRRVVPRLPEKAE